MDNWTAKDIAKETEKVTESFQLMTNLCIDLADERDALKRQRDEALGKSPLLEKSQAEANEVETKDLKPALILALVQRDVAMRSVRKIHKISELINAWDGNAPQCLDGIVVSDGTSEPNALDIVRHIKDVILKPEEAV